MTLLPAIPALLDHIEYLAHDIIPIDRIRAECLNLLSLISEPVIELEQREDVIVIDVQQTKPEAPRLRSRLVALG